MINVDNLFCLSILQKICSLGTSDWIALLTGITSIILTILIFAIEHRISFSQKMEHSVKVRDIAKTHLIESENKTRNYAVEIRNARMQKEKYIFTNNTFNVFKGFSSTKGALIGAHIDGIEIEESSSANINGREVRSILRIPYKHILFIDVNGDETTPAMIFYVKSPLFKFPYHKQFFVYKDTNRTVTDNYKSVLKLKLKTRVLYTFSIYI